MSVQYQKEIFSNNNIKLFANFSGIEADDTTTPETVSLNIYAFRVPEYVEIFAASLSFDQIVALFNHLGSVSFIRDNKAVSSSRFVEIKPEVHEIIAMLDIVDVALVKAILQLAGEDRKLSLLIEALTDSEIQNLYASIQQNTYKKEIANLELLLELEGASNLVEQVKTQEKLASYMAGQPEKIFQNWIEKNTWTLGVDYIKKHSARKIGINSEGDLLMETTDGFIDLIELKRPKFELFSFDNSHNSYYPSVELSKVLGQCLQYLSKLDDYKLILEKEYQFKILRPRIKIIVGRSNNFNELQYSALRMLNSSLNHLEVITYDYLLHCGNNIISYYQNKTS